ncbi:hypothetical protein J3B00_003724 [Pseudomonas sp. BP8]|nr:hypothetical protein [Pseudomonas sp. BP8]
MSREEVGTVTVVYGTGFAGVRGASPLLQGLPDPLDCTYPVGAGLFREEAGTAAVVYGTGFAGVRGASPLLQGLPNPLDCTYPVGAGSFH